MGVEKEPYAAQRTCARGWPRKRGLERQARRVRSSGLTTASFTTRLMTFLATSLLVLGAAPAVALAGAKNSRSEATQSNSQINQQSTPTRQAGAKLLASGAGYRSASGSVAVRVLQRRLAKDGYGPGPIDGRYGPETMQAVDRFQAAAGLAVNGIAGPVTLGALGHPPEMLSEGAGYTGHGSRQVRELQRQLAKHGYGPGPADGRYGPQTMNAVARFQAAHGLVVDGIAGPITLTALSNPRQGAVRGHRLRHRTRLSASAGTAAAPCQGRRSAWPDRRSLRPRHPTGCGARSGRPRSAGQRCRRQPHAGRTTAQREGTQDQPSSTRNPPAHPQAASPLHSQPTNQHPEPSQQATHQHPGPSRQASHQHPRPGRQASHPRWRSCWPRLP